MRLLPHQREFVERVYSGDVRLAVSSVARGNGKTGLIAGLVCCHLFGPEAEPRGEIYSAACSAKQAALVFAEVEAIVRAVPEFKQFRIKTSTFYKTMEAGAGPGEGTVYGVLPGDKEAAHGLAPSCGYTMSLALRPTGSCSMPYRRQVVSVRARSALPSRPKLPMTDTRSHN